MDELHARNIACVYGTVRRLVTGEQDGRRGRKTTARFKSHPIDENIARLPKLSNAAVATGHTLYPNTIVRDLEGARLLKSGFNSRKIGARILKGHWRGMPVHTLTLEERATCPTSCRHWRSCTGNHMQWAQRFAHGTEFELALVSEVVDIARANPRGFVVRLHQLGDFYSVRYVNIWRAMIETLPPLRVFGYTARWDDDIGRALQALVAQHWDRFALRFSNAPLGHLPTTVTIEHPIQLPADAFICPEQTERTESCSTCGACWSTTKRVAFLQH
jgi:hypothetical protein